MRNAHFADNLGMIDKLHEVHAYHINKFSIMAVIYVNKQVRNMLKLRK
jgi:hypothetical protein